MADCDNCVTHLKKSHTLSHALRAAHKRRAGKEGTDSTVANMQEIESHKNKMRADDEEENSFAFREIGVECENDGLNDELIDMHMDMQLLSSL